jgi:hypothetical protein
MSKNSYPLPVAKINSNGHSGSEKTEVGNDAPLKSSSSSEKSGGQGGGEGGSEGKLEVPEGHPASASLNSEAKCPFSTLWGSKDAAKEKAA